ncbi:Glyoxalase-like domain protein [compost metagenome]
MKIRLDLVGIVVKNMKESLAFYRVLGLNIPEEMDEAGHVEVNQDGVRLAFDMRETVKDMYGVWEEPAGHRIELAFLCENRESLDELYKKIVDHGYAGIREPWDAFWGQRYAVVQDPDGNLISLFV